MSESIRLGPEREWGTRTCGFGLTDQPQCDEPAVHHVMWLKSWHTSNTCAEHMAFIKSRDTSAEPWEVHAFGPNCGMPGALWHHPYEDEDEGYCMFPAVDDLALVVEEIQPIEVTP